MSGRGVFFATLMPNVRKLIEEGRARMAAAQAAEDAADEQRIEWVKAVIAERDAAVARAEVAEAEVTRLRAVQQAISECRDDPAAAIVAADRIAGKAIIRAEVAEAALAEAAQARSDAWREGFRAGRGADHNPTWWPQNPYLTGDTPTEPTGDEPRPGCFCGDSASEGVHRAHECVQWTSPPAAPTQDGEDRPEPHDPPCGWCAACFPERSR